MTHYQEILLIPTPEFNTNVVMNSLYDVLHHALVAMSASDTAISFPGISSTGLGNRVRLYTRPERLQQLSGHIAASAIRDHLKIGNILETPETTEAMTVRRVQCKSNVERLRRRYMKRHGASEQEAQSIIPENSMKHLSLPYATLFSQSTGHSFRLFIQQQKVTTPVKGLFNSYGLSDHATVPMF
ncbi:type I-F CRISPR-associated endoribonuclease Cas6/Csy4 (plasmid) [Chlorobium phaeovibrioides]|uniref:Type I-F CRISPR-associated endoribonuclease Cas6/Csy4 n=1 Tax=Chlorobium phaeovibrioides TaxID=1094 RepID=A0A5M8I7Z5_CHLPH|nr:type I-F CRISPR-associated endoribonuclease Cas6/Csy4 [Chlorobium phaeovibrioides]KAA6230502.1 type I-F CRISPR-associated endoribonuclease Cas6/Csy4 [Chlorobium phaeovibrioides]